MTFSKNDEKQSNINMKRKVREFLTESQKDDGVEAPVSKRVKHPIPEIEAMATPPKLKGGVMGGPKGPRPTPPHIQAVIDGTANGQGVLVKGEFDTKSSLAYRSALNYHGKRTDIKFSALLTQENYLWVTRM